MFKQTSSRRSSPRIGSHVHSMGRTAQQTSGWPWERTTGMASRFTRVMTHGSWRHQSHPRSESAMLDDGVPPLSRGQMAHLRLCNENLPISKVVSADHSVQPAVPSRATHMLMRCAKRSGFLVIPLESMPMSAGVTMIIACVMFILPSRVINYVMHWITLMNQ